MLRDSADDKFSAPNLLTTLLLPDPCHASHIALHGTGLWVRSHTCLKMRSNQIPLSPKPLATPPTPRGAWEHSPLGRRRLTFLAEVDLFHVSLR